jgi:hypothetical protein
MKPTAKKKKAPTKRTAKRAKVQKATVEFTRGEAYAMLSGVSAALENGITPPKDMQGDLYSAVTKFRLAFKFKEGEKY